MSDSVIQDSGDRGGSTTPWATPGMLLRQARVDAGMHVDALAAALKVPVYKLEALEGDRLDIFPDAVFVRALASSICRTLKVDAAPVLELLPQSQPPRLSVDKGINAAFKDGHAAKRVTSASLAGQPSGTRWVPVVVLLLLVAALVLVFLPRGMDQWRGGETTTAAAVSPAVSSGAPGVRTVEVPEAVVPASATAESAVAPFPADVASAAPQASPSVPVASAAAPASVPAVAASAPAASGSELLVIRARGETWVQIRNQVGGASVQRVLRAGDSLVAQGEPPWAVVVGKASVTDVLVRGERLDLSTIAREDVARFEVK